MDIYNETFSTFSKLEELLTFSITQRGKLIVTLNNTHVHMLGEIGMFMGSPSFPPFYLPPAFLDATLEATRAALGIKADDDLLCADWLADCIRDLMDEAMGGGEGLSIQVEAFFACRPWLEQA
jgi:hypothetical protein